ncbi:exodeoxyribonuclease III [Candidatus Stoquefichus massiliensis]|uniref:exodeoxyribonuclease III n=1 Tax=Candidatus Stoquefichus massiliensis TaxID=1470350 RepID=UPI0004874CAC|nr:exodeoxyribonuclease III [Candidatus Stoquefichus massiliensis]
MLYVSWNVNGLRACVNKGFPDFFRDIDADIFAIQETKLQKGQIDLEFEGYTSYFNDAIKKGYSGTAIYTKKEPIHVTYGIGIEEHDQEGRVITLEFEKYYFVTVYTPNSKRELERLDYRQIWEDEFRTYLLTLKKKKSVVICGDLNVAHQEIDLKNDKTNHKNAGFTDEERTKFTQLLESGFIDTFRYKYPTQETYSWWSYMFKAREKNAGWRIDYFVVSEELKDQIKDAYIYTDIMGSDHCPVGVELEGLE